MATIHRNYTAIETDAGLDRTPDIDAASHLISRLSYHCGPFARYASIVRSDGLQQYSEFTKDGITLARTMRSTDERENAMRHLAKYVGDRVNSRCHDSTTTSMILFLRFLKDCVDRWSTVYNRMTPGQFDRLISDILDRIKERLVGDTATVESLMKDFHITREQAVRFVAYHQSMISSKGNVQLADAITEAVANTPPELYNLFRIIPTDLETDESVIVDVQDGDFVLGAYLTDTTRLNHLLGTEYLGIGVDLFVTPNELVSNSPETRSVIEYINKTGGLNRDLVIICPGQDSTILTAISNYNNTSGTRGKVIIFTMTALSLNFATVQALAINVIAGKTDPTEVVLTHRSIDPAIIPNVTVNFRGGRLSIKGLYDKDGGVFHPYYTNPDLHEDYTYLREHLMHVIEKHKASHSAGDKTGKIILDATSIYTQLVMQKVVSLRIAGTTHDSLALQSVAEDAYGATVSALEDGFIVGGHHRMRDALLAIAAENAASVELYPRTLRELASAFAVSIYQLLQTIYYPPVPSILGDTPRTVDLPYTDLSHAAQRYTYLAIGEDQIHGVSQPTVETITYEDHPTRTHLIQPVAGYMEMLLRMKELLSKYAVTALVIEPEN